MNQQELENLSLGDVVASRVDNQSYVVTANYGGRATAVKSVDITNAAEWEIVLRANYAKPNKPTDLKSKSTHLIAHLRDRDNSQSNNRWFFQLPDGSVATLSKLEAEGWRLTGVYEGSFFFTKSLMTTICPSVTAICPPTTVISPDDNNLS